jgi:glycosyltransferase involved in cell wall biosynthesis
MLLLSLKDLPPPPEGKIGFPWTEQTPPQYKTENWPKISIITPCFNQGQFIEETIRSVLLQSYPNLEYIIIDGGSTDNTVEIIEKYQNFITYWVSEKDNGQSHAINKGLKHATGEVFNWLNSDDYYLPNALLTIGKYFAGNNQLEVLCGREIHLSQNGDLSAPTHGTPLLATIEATIVQGHCNQPPTFFRLSIVKTLGGVSEDLYFCMDSDLWTRYLAHYGWQNVLKIEAVINVFRLHDHSKSLSAQPVYYTDRFNILVSLLESADIPEFPRRFLRDNDFFKIYFKQNYPLSIFNKKELGKEIACKLLFFYCQHMTWTAFFELYVYTLKQQPFGFNTRFYLLSFLKFKRLLNTWL